MSIQQQPTIRYSVIARNWSYVTISVEIDGKFSHTQNVQEVELRDPKLIEHRIKKKAKIRPQYQCSKPEIPEVKLDKKRYQAIKCQFKKVFRSKEYAYAFLSENGINQRPYRCHVCGRVHLTSKIKS